MVKQENLEHSKHRHFCPMNGRIVRDKCDHWLIDHNVIHRNEHYMFDMFAKRWILF
mgnify:CR=1 FL=1